MLTGEVVGSTSRIATSELTRESVDADELSPALKRSSSFDGVGPPSTTSPLKLARPTSSV